MCRVSISLFLFFLNPFPPTPKRKSPLRSSTALDPARGVRLVPLYHPPSAFEVFLSSATMFLPSITILNFEGRLKRPAKDLYPAW